MTLVDRILILPGHNLLTELPASFVRDDFNLAGLEDRSDLSDVEQCLNDLLYCYDSDTDMMSDTDSDSDESNVADKHKHLYYALHQRYALTKTGMLEVTKLWEQGVFGKCRRHYCQYVNLLPLGPSATVGRSVLRGWCPKCKELYSLQGRRNVDGASYGPTVACMIALTIPAVRAIFDSYPNPAVHDVYVPRIYGFRLARHLGM